MSTMMVKVDDVFEILDRVRDNALQIPERPAWMERELWSVSEVKKEIEKMYKVDVESICEDVCDNFCKHTNMVHGGCPIHCPLDPFDVVIKGEKI